MNLLFIGGAGFIGSSLVHKFITDKEHKIFVFEPHFANIGKLDDIAQSITIIRGSLADIDLLTSIIVDHAIDTIVHLVSTLIPGSTYDDYQREFENVIFPSVQLMSICSNKGVKFIYFSSGGTIYGNKATGKFSEEDSPAPISYYGLSKQIIESSILFENRVRNLSYLIIRPSNPFGKGQNLNGNQGLIAVAIGKILANETIDIWGDGTSVRDYIYIDDLANNFYNLLLKGIQNEIFNIGSGKGHSINDIITILEEITEIPIKRRYIDKRNVDVNAMVLDITKLKNTISTTPSQIKEGISVFYMDARKLLKK